MLSFNALLTLCTMRDDTDIRTLGYSRKRCVAVERCLLMGAAAALFQKYDKKRTVLRRVCGVGVKLLQIDAVFSC